MTYFPPKEWDPDNLEDALQDEKEVYRDELPQPEDHVKKILRDNAPFAAKSIAWLAHYSEKDELRLRAAQYIIERVMGKANDAGFNATQEDTLESLLKQILQPQK